jgi:hypothetical protein
LPPQEQLREHDGQKAEERIVAAAGRTMTKAGQLSVLSRRRVLQLMAGAGAVALRPSLLARAVAGTAPVATLPSYGFLTAEELAILDAATSLILPTDELLPGAREIGVVGYVESLLNFLPGSDANCDRFVNVADLTAVEHKALGQFLGCAQGGDVNGDGSVDRADARAAEAASFRARPMFAGGPFSGRSPQPHFPIGTTPCSECHSADGNGRVPSGAGAGGAKVELYPPPAFRQFLPMNRLQTLSWKVRILGPEAVTEVRDNEALAAFVAQLPEVDLRNRYRAGLAELESLAGSSFGKRFVELTAEQQREVLNRAEDGFVDLVTRHVIQGTLCAPEYGGNLGGLGWQLAGFDGDSQPLGYEIYDESVSGSYRERDDKPNSRPDRGETCAGFSDDMKRFLEFISSVTGGGPLGEPGCLELDP